VNDIQPFASRAGRVPFLAPVTGFRASGFVQANATHTLSRTSITTMWDVILRHFSRLTMLAWDNSAERLA
jgi:hypothetical protein